MIFQYGSEPVIIQLTFNGFKAQNFFINVRHIVSVGLLPIKFGCTSLKVKSKDFIRYRFKLFTFYYL